MKKVVWTALAPLMAGAALAGNEQSGHVNEQGVQLKVSQLIPSDKNRAWNSGQTQITVIGANGHRLWQQQVSGPLYLGNKGFKSWGVTGGAVWVTALRGEVSWRTDNIGFRLSDGKKLWEVTDVGSPLAQNGSELLFQWGQSIDAYPDLRLSTVYVLNTQTGQMRTLKLTIPERPGCGDINRYSLGDLADRAGKADKTYFYLRHQDKCGVFTARFNWHRTGAQKPVIQPE